MIPGLSAVFVYDKRTGALLDQIGVEGIEPHGMTRSDDGRIWFSNDHPERDFRGALAPTLTNTVINEEY